MGSNFGCSHRSRSDNISGVAEKLDRNDVVAAAKGNEAAFVRLVAAYEKPVYNLALRMVRSRVEAEDLSQDVFVHLLDILDRYDPARPFEPWLFRVATNYILNHVKRRRIDTVSMEQLRPAGNPDAAPVELADHDSLSVAPLELSERNRLVQNAVSELPPDWRAVITLHYMQSFSVGDIATILEIPTGTVKNRLFRARNALYEKLLKLLETWDKGWM